MANGKVSVPNVLITAVLALVTAAQLWTMNKVVQNGEAIARNDPPAWVLAWMDRIESRLDGIDEKLERNGGG